jgi:uncharacterized protein DUF6893
MSSTNIVLVVVGVAIVALIVRGVAPELYRYMRIRRM